MKDKGAKAPKAEKEKVLPSLPEKFVPFKDSLVGLFGAYEAGDQNKFAVSSIGLINNLILAADGDLEKANDIEFPPELFHYLPAPVRATMIEAAIEKLMDDAKKKFKT